MLAPEITQLKNAEDKFRAWLDAAPDGIIIVNLKGEIVLVNRQFESEGLRVRKDGTTFYANALFTPLYDDHQNLYGYAKVTRDLTTERKTVEDLVFPVCGV